MSALQQFFNTERIGRGWTMRQIANRSQISLSKAYAISNGDDNVEFETFENIAAAFNMSPAELAVAIGKGAAADDPKRVSIHAALREVPDEQLATLDLMIRSLAATNTSGEEAANGPGSRNNGRRKPHTPPFQSQKHGRVAAFAASVFASIVRPQRVFALPSAATT